ncbi:MAG TPA: ATP-binding cassette domain-containing protein, partial [Bacteroidetes bacterium]|nr:ATP-binding cassette domain-containing protein [Bacteroidota bacterium]
GLNDELHRQGVTNDNLCDTIKQLEFERDGIISKRTSVADSVKTLAICKSINQTLSQQQKVVVLSCLFELIKSDRRFTAQRMQIIDTVSDVFNFDKNEFSAIQTFIINDEPEKLDVDDVLVLSDQDNAQFTKAMHISSELLEGLLFIMKVSSVDLYFLRYIGKEELSLNGLILNEKRVYLFAPGSTIRPTKAKPIYYSDVVAKFLRETEVERISFNVSGLEHQFENGVSGIRNVDISEEQGKLFGIMGSSGAGKTTLLNILSGQQYPTKGKVLVNGVDIYLHKKQVKGIFGYIPQDDLLIEELTVYQNLYYNAKLCLGSWSDEEIKNIIQQTLNDLGLWNIRNLKVGNPLQKTISGGQRKRLNIALELIREPAILFVDEPTSGLSSKDSENVMDLLRELSLKGKLIFVVIHQPSSDIYKLFDKIFILDQGGYPIYYGNPLEALIYFKTLDKQINNTQAECLNCGNVNVELVFNIIKANVVDEYGQFTGARKVSALKWHELFVENTSSIQGLKDETIKLKGNLVLPNRAKQYFIFTVRDMLSKLANRQYVLINLLEAPLLALILSFIVRFVDTYNGEYAFGLNDNIPAYFFMCIIVALFMGMTVSAEEIVRDQKI